jgi:branched-chain amino acid transport system substrate-binding protein
VPPEQYTSQAADWREAYKFKYGSDPEVYSIYGYTAATVIMDALNRVCASGGDPTDRNVVREAVLATENFETVIGPITFDENGDPVQLLMSGSQVVNGQFEFVTILSGDSSR